MLGLQNLAQSQDVKVSNLIELACSHLDIVIGKLGLDLKFTGSYWVGRCPVHNGDNPTAFNLYPTGETFPGYWVCWTHHCEEYGKGIIYLIQKVLEVNRAKAIKWLEHTLENLEPVIVEPVKKKQPKPLERSLIRSRLEIPPKFYLDKSYSYGILDMYDVGVCNNPNKEMYQRVVFPIYFEGKYVGCQGRTLNGGPKWKTSKGCKITDYLYNYDSLVGPYAILVESCGNVLRLVQNDIKNAVGLFGSNLSDKQVIDLERKGIQRVYVCMDSDKAGKAGFRKIARKLKHLKPIEILIDYPDVSDIPNELVYDLFKDYK